MDIQIRKQLEQLEYIKDKLEYIEYDKALDCYIEKQDGLPTGVAAWVNGAFYGFEQAAKAQAVPDLGELQERIAGHQYYHDEHGHMIVDMDDVVKEISGFDSWKSQAVPSGFILVERTDLECAIDALKWASNEDSDLCAKQAAVLEGAIEAQELAND